MKKLKIDEYKLLKKFKKNPKKSTKLINVEKKFIFSKNKFSTFFGDFFHFPLELYRIQLRHVAGLAPIEFQGKNIEKSRKKFFLKKIKKNTKKSRTSKNPEKS